MSDTVTAALLIIGNEILSGRTQDKNLAYLGRQCTALGVRLSEVRVVPDVEDEIVAALNALRARYRYVFTTGGIGPTHDDITAAAVAKAFGRKVIRHPEAVARLSAHYEARDREFNEARMKMAETPEGATLVDNPLSAAPGFRVENVYVLAGVPSVMQAMFDHVATTLEGGAKLLSRAIDCGLGEGRIAAGLGAVQADFADVDIGSYPYFREGVYGTVLVLRGVDAQQIDAAAERVETLVRELGGEPRPVDES